MRLGVLKIAVAARLMRPMLIASLMSVIWVGIMLTGRSLQAAQAQAATTATAATAKTIDIKSAVEMGLKNSPAVREAEGKHAEARYKKYLSRSDLFPKVSLMATSNYQKDSVANKTVGSVPFSGEAYNLYNVGFHAEQTLLAYGFFADAAAASLEQDIEGENLSIARRDLTKNVILAFYKTVTHESRIRLLRDQEKRVSDTLAVAQRRMGIGGKRIDVLQVKTQLALLQPKIERAKNDLAAATAELAHLLGTSESSSLNIRGETPVLSVKDVKALLDLKNYQIPELKRSALQRSHLDKQRDVALGGNLPNLKVVGDYGYVNYTKADLIEAASKSWSVKLVLTVPLFSGFSFLSERRALASRETQIKAQEHSVRNALSLEQIKSYAQLESAEAALVSAEEAAKLARESLVEARREYRSGLFDFLQFFQVESSSFEAEVSLLELRQEVISAYCTYFTASGQPLSLLVELLAKAGAKS